MPEPLICHLPHMKALFCIDADHLAHARLLLFRSTAIVVSDMTGLEDRQ